MGDNEGSYGLLYFRTVFAAICCQFMIIGFIYIN